MKFILFSLLGFLLGTPAWSAEIPTDTTKPLSIDDAVALALKNNLSLRTEAMKTAVKEREKDLAWNRLVPTASVSSGAARLNTTTEGFAPFTYTIPAWSASVGFSTQLNLSIALFHAIDQTVIDFQNSSLSTETAKKKLVRDVRKAFYQLLALQESIKLTERQIANAEQRYRQTLASFQGGLTSNVSVLQAQVNWQNMKPTLETQRVGYRQAMMSFAFLLGLDVRTPLTLSGVIEVPKALPALSPDSYISHYLAGRLDVQSINGSLRSLENAVKLEQDQLWPTLSFGWSASPSISDPFNPNTDLTKSSNWIDSSGAFSVSLRWQLDSLIPGLSTWTSNEATKDQLAQTKLAADQVRSQAVMEILTLTDQISKSSQSLDTLALNVDLAQKSYQQTTTAYNAGNQTLVEVQDADLALQSAQYQVLNEKLNLVNNLLDLEYALNAPKEEFLQGEKN